MVEVVGLIAGVSNPVASIADVSPPGQLTAGSDRQVHKESTQAKLAMLRAKFIRDTEVALARADYPSWCRRTGTTTR